MTRIPRTRSVSAARPLRALAVGVLLAGVLTACGGEESSSGGVAAIEEGSGGGSSSSASPTASGDAEQQLLDYVECLRGEGLDVPDPTVDAEGNLTLRPQGGAGAGAGQRLDREQFQKAQETCGQPPEGALGIDEQDRSELQDAALEFAKCMRGEGIDVPDPDFSQGGPGAGGQGPFGDLDTDDPKVAAAMEKCQSAFGDALPGGGQ
ncbi:MAG: hypothetical protein ACRCY8_17990 [Dermatophilaceae bacterium]